MNRPHISFATQHAGNAVSILTYLWVVGQGGAGQSRTATACATRLQRVGFTNGHAAPCIILVSQLGQVLVYK